MRRPRPVIRRVSDRSLWRASCPPDYNAGHAFADVWNRVPRYYFRGVERVRWLWPFHRWRDNGLVWEPKHPDEFDILPVGGGR